MRRRGVDPGAPGDNALGEKQPYKGGQPDPRHHRIRP
jgi:hypothetical protein